MASYLVNAKILNNGVSTDCPTTNDGQNTHLVRNTLRTYLHIQKMDYTRQHLLDRLVSNQRSNEQNELVQHRVSRTVQYGPLKISSLQQAEEQVQGILQEAGVPSNLFP